VGAWWIPQSGSWAQRRWESTERLSRRTDAPPAPITQEDRDRFVEHAAEQARTRGSVDPAIISRAARDRLALLSEDHTVPPFDRLFVDVDDHVWVRDYVHSSAADQPQNWAIYDGGGYVVGAHGDSGGAHGHERGTWLPGRRRA
jgi:hypothetical protein